MFDIFRVIGAAGLILICIGIVMRKRKRQDEIYIAGGICLEIYSIYIGDIIFIVLQLAFIMAASYDYIRKPKKDSIFTGTMNFLRRAD